MDATTTIRFRPRWVACLLLGFASQAGATLVPEMTFEQVVEESETIVHGRVVFRHAAWDPEGAAIWTHYEIEVVEMLKGDVATKITVSEPGGEVDGERMDVVGAPRYAIGEEVAVFAAPTPIGFRRTCGWGQGKFTIFEAPTPSGRAVRSVLADLALIADPDKATSRVRRSATSLASLDGLDFEAFKLRVRELVRRAATAR